MGHRHSRLIIVDLRLSLTFHYNMNQWLTRWEACDVVDAKFGWDAILTVSMHWCLVLNTLFEWLLWKWDVDLIPRLYFRHTWPRSFYGMDVQEYAHWDTGEIGLVERFCYPGSKSTKWNCGVVSSLTWIFTKTLTDIKPFWTKMRFLWIVSIITCERNDVVNYLGNSVPNIP